MKDGDGRLLEGSVEVSEAQFLAQGSHSTPGNCYDQRMVALRLALYSGRFALGVLFRIRKTKNPS